VKQQADVIVKRLFYAAESPNLRACQAIAAPIVGAWHVTYGYNDIMGYWVRFEHADYDAMKFSVQMFGDIADFLYTSHDHHFTRQDLIGCLLAVDAQANKKLPK